MMDYTNLLRMLKTYEDGYSLYLDAADAIEALQAEIRESMQRCAECGDELAHQMPKRGEWVELGYQPNVHETRYRCSLCGRQVLILSGSGELLKTYPYCHCGAKMEVQE